MYKATWGIVVTIQIQMEEESEPSLGDISQCKQACEECSVEGEASFDLQHPQQLLKLLQSGQPIFVATQVPVSDRVPLERHRQCSRQKRIKLKILSYNRKQKSLQELSRKFIAHFEGRDGYLLELDKVTLQLGVERRRIYDIINILESLDVVRKTGKNHYIWRGLQQAICTIRQAQQLGPDHPVPRSKKEKSLEYLAARFLRLFLHRQGAISLQDAAKELIRSHDSVLFKTKIRRLYDIVNVYKSLGVVRKVHIDLRKPGFLWVGVEKLEQIIRLKQEEVRTATQIGLDEPGRDQKLVKLDENRSVDILGTICEASSRGAKENLPFLSNSEWMGPETKQGLFRRFSHQKIFYPEIISRQNSAFNFCVAPKQAQLIDAYDQY